MGHRMGLSIGEFAKRAEINVSTLRFYERKGLVPEPARTPHGHRCYADDDLARLRFIKGTQGLGFTLAEIKELLAIRDLPGGSCGAMRERASHRLAATERRIEELMEARASLERLVAACTSGADNGCCPTIAALETGRLYP